MIYVLSWPPSVNHYWRIFAKNGPPRMIISAQGRAYRNAVLAEVIPKHAIAMTGRLTVSIYVHAPDNRARDLDNICKAIFDALQNAGVYVNDSQIDHFSVTRKAPQAGLGRVEVEIHED